MKGNNNYGYKKTQKQINLVAHDRVLVFENFRYLMESLEEYIEKVGCFPNFKRQFRNITIPKEKKYSVKNCENLFRTKLLIFLGVLSDDTPDDTRKEVKEEFWKWIGSVGVDANNCPDEKLKHFLVEVNNVIEGSSEKVFEQTKKRLDDKYKNNPPSWESIMKVFSSVQNPLDKKRDQEESYKNKNYFEVRNENRIEGVKEKGEQVYNQLTGLISSDDFNFYSSQVVSKDDSGLLTAYKVDSEMYIDETKPYEAEYNLALWKWNNWTEEDYRNNGETREGLQKWIIELEFRRQQAQIEQQPAYNWDLR